jgi:hypothetical protein
VCAAKSEVPWQAGKKQLLLNYNISGGTEIEPEGIEKRYEYTGKLVEKKKRNT